MPLVPECMDRPLQLLEDFGKFFAEYWSSHKLLDFANPHRHSETLWVYTFLHCGNPDCSLMGKSSTITTRLVGEF